MLRIFFCVLIFANSAFGQDNKERTDLLKKEAATLRTGVDDAVYGASASFPLLQGAKATYLEGYGFVVTLETALGPTRNPFTSDRSPNEVRTIVAQRRKEIQQKLENLLKERARALQSMNPADSLTIVLYLVNSNPADVPDLPAQIVLTTKKQNPDQVLIREF